MDLKVHLPVVTILLGNGYSYNYFCSQFLPMFYRIPKEILEVKGKELLDIPRTPFLAFNDEETILRINSDIFMNGIINSVAYMVYQIKKKFYCNMQSNTDFYIPNFLLMMEFQALPLCEQIFSVCNKWQKTEKLLQLL